MKINTFGNEYSLKYHHKNIKFKKYCKIKKK